MNKSFVIYAGQPRLVQENFKTIFYTLKKFNAKAIFAFWEKDYQKNLNNFLKTKIPDSQIYYIKSRNELTNWIQDKDSKLSRQLIINILQFDALDQAYQLLENNNKLDSNTLIVRSRTDLYIKPKINDLIYKKKCIIAPGCIFGVGISDYFSYGTLEVMKIYFKCLDSMIFLYKSGYILPPEIVLGLHLGKNKTPFFINRKLNLKLLQKSARETLNARTSYHDQLAMRPSLHFGQFLNKEELKDINESFLDEISNRLEGIKEDLIERIFKKNFP